MSYTKVIWANAPATTTPLGATNLSHLEQGVYDAHYPPLVSALPGSPSDGQTVWLSPASFQTGTPFHPAMLCRYRASTFAAYHWECAGGIIDASQPVGNQTVSSITYTIPGGTAGPTGLVIPFAGEYDIEIGATLAGAATGTAQTAWLSYDAGASPAVDADALTIPIVSTTGQGSYSRRYRRTFATPVTLVPKLRTSSTLNTPTISHWVMRAFPILIG